MKYPLLYSFTNLSPKKNIPQELKIIKDNHNFGILTEYTYTEYYVDYNKSSSSLKKTEGYNEMLKLISSDPSKVMDYCFNFEENNYKFDVDIINKLFEKMFDFENIGVFTKSGQTKTSVDIILKFMYTNKILKTLDYVELNSDNFRMLVIYKRFFKYNAFLTEQITAYFDRQYNLYKSDTATPDIKNKILKIFDTMPFLSKFFCLTYNDIYKNCTSANLQCVPLSLKKLFSEYLKIKKEYYIKLNSTFKEIFTNESTLTNTNIACNNEITGVASKNFLVNTVINDSEYFSYDLVQYFLRYANIRISPDYPYKTEIPYYLLNSYLHCIIENIDLVTKDYLDPYNIPTKFNINEPTKIIIYNYFLNAYINTILTEKSKNPDFEPEKFVNVIPEIIVGFIIESNKKKYDDFNQCAQWLIYN